MATIYWAESVNGSWTAANDWAGGVVPGADDTAVINATGGKGYTVDINSRVTVAGLDLDSANATLHLSSALTASVVELEAGILLLSAGKLSGTVDDTGGVLEIGVNKTSVLNNVTWHGALDPIYNEPRTSHKGYGALIISQGLTLTGAGGTGPGSANFTGFVEFNGLTNLDNAVITAVDFSITNSPTLTFGSGLTVNATDISSSGTLLNEGVVDANISVATLVNDGTLTTGSIETSDFINNGTVNAVLSSYFPVTFTGSATNNGIIDVAAGQALLMMTSNLITAGASSSIVLDGGVLYLQTPEGVDITTSQLLADYTLEHVVGSGDHGFGIFATGSLGEVVSGTLDNARSTLDIDPGSAVGTLGPFASGTIEGGTLIYNGTAPIDSGTSGYQFDDLTLQSSSPTLSLGDIGLKNVDLIGPTAISVDVAPQNGTSSINGGTLSGVGTLIVGNPNAGSDGSSAEINLSHVDITGVGDSGIVNISVSPDATLNVTQQAIDGYTIGLSSAEMIIGDANNATINVTSDTTTASSFTGGMFGSGTLGRGMHVNIASGATLDFTYTDGTLTNAGHMSVAPGGTLAIANGSQAFDNSGFVTSNGGVVVLAPAYLDNTGSITVANGTLILQGPLTVASLSAIAHPGSEEVVSGTLDLGGGLVTLGSNGVPTFDLDNGVINDGTIDIKQAQDVVWSGASSVDATLINNGNITIGAGQYYPITAINDAISGKGTISLGATGDAYGQLAIGSTVAAGQTLAFLGGSDLLRLANPTAYTDFAGTLSGFAVGDSICFGADGGVYGAEFFGKSIFVQFNDGSSVDLATSTALTGSLAVGTINGFAAITYVPNATSVHDWSFPGLGSHFGDRPQMGSRDIIMGMLAITEHDPQGWFFPHLSA